MKHVKQKLTLDRPATYQIKVPGYLDESWSDWAGGMTITLESGDDGPPATTLTGVVADQAALQGLLRRLYSLGLPLISVNCVEPDLTETIQPPPIGKMTTAREAPIAAKKKSLADE
jgi:hypothetical protein